MRRPCLCYDLSKHICIKICKNDSFNTHNEISTLKGVSFILNEKIGVFSEGSVWRSGSMQGWQPKGRWFKLRWWQSLFVGGNVSLGLCEIGG